MTINNINNNINGFGASDLISESNSCQTVSINNKNLCSVNPDSLNAISNNHESLTQIQNDSPRLPVSQSDINNEEQMQLLRDILMQSGDVEAILGEMFLQMKKAKQMEKAIKHQLREQEFNQLECQEQSLIQQAENEKMSAWVNFAASIAGSAGEIAGATLSYKGAQLNNNTEAAKYNYDSELARNGGKLASDLIKTINDSFGFAAEAKENELDSQHHANMARRINGATEDVSELIQSFSELEKEVLQRIEQIMESKSQAFQSIIRG